MLQGPWLTFSEYWPAFGDVDQLRKRTERTDGSSAPASFPDSCYRPGHPWLAKHIIGSV